MMKTTYLLGTLLCSISIFAQTTIATTLTLAHQEIRGSKISMIPPKDFDVATAFMGYQQLETNSSIMVKDLLGPYAGVSKGLTKESLMNQGVRVEILEQITFNELPGIFIVAEQTTNAVQYRKYFLVTGTEKETIIMTGMTPKGDAERENFIKNVLLSSVYDPDKLLTPLDAVDFEISITGTDFVFAKSMSNMLIYNRDGKIPSETLDKASMIIAKAFSKIEILDKKEFATNRIKTLPVQITKIHSIAPIELSGLSGYEITAEGVDRKKGTPEQAYQVMLFVENSYYILFGSSEKDFETNLKVFKKLVRSFQLK
jgi:hypothetical protein